MSWSHPLRRGAAEYVRLDKHSRFITRLFQALGQAARLWALLPATSFHRLRLACCLPLLLRQTLTFAYLMLSNTFPFQVLITDPFKSLLSSSTYLQADTPLARLLFPGLSALRQ